MTTVPQELLDAILQEVDDTTALKACALVAPSFRESSQRILLSSLMLDGYRARSPSALLALFIESPHLPAYITTFKLRLSSLDIRTRDTSLRDVLASLNNVRRFTIAGASSAESWDDIISVVPGLIDFIERQTLAELHLFFLHKIPIPILARFASSATTVTFCVALAMHGETKDLPIPFPPPRMTQLVLSDQAETICDVLSRPQFAPYMAALRRLKLRPQHPYSSNIISSAAHGLEHLRLDCSIATLRSDALSPLPPMMALRFIDLIISTVLRNAEWLIANLPTLLASAPTHLEEISLTHAIMFRPSIPAQQHTLEALDRIFIESACSPRLRWRLEFEGDKDGQHLANFAQFVRHWMPRMHAARKVLFQRHSFADDLREWPVQ
ncbi:hypothetical protein B0H13DRAFT_1946357 [Mycena leptocephala]|nr:hypothetical protein B0H13DRAFT_1946357 [Mycena leptocephala]